jgi:hypothetical protein
VHPFVDFRLPILFMVISNFQIQPLRYALPSKESSITISLELVMGQSQITRVLQLFGLVLVIAIGLVEISAPLDPSFGRNYPANQKTI